MHPIWACLMAALIPVRVCHDAAVNSVPDISSEYCAELLVLASSRYERGRSDGFPKGMLSVRSNSSSGSSALLPDLSPPALQHFPGSRSSSKSGKYSTDWPAPFQQQGLA